MIGEEIVPFVVLRTCTPADLSFEITIAFVCKFFAPILGDFVMNGFEAIISKYLKRTYKERDFFLSWELDYLFWPLT